MVSRYLNDWPVTQFFFLLEFNLIPFPRLCNYTFISNHDFYHHFQKKKKKRMNSDFNYFLAYNFRSLNAADYFLRKLESRWKENEAFFSFWFTFFAKGHHQIFLWKIWTSGTKCLMNFHVKKSQKLILSLCFNFLHEKSKFRESYIHHIKGGKCNNQKLAANSFPFDRSHEVHSWQMSRCFLHAPPSFSFYKNLVQCYSNDLKSVMFFFRN